MEWIIGIGIALAIGAFIAWRLWANIDPFWHKRALDRALILIKGTPEMTQDGVKMFYEKGVAKVSHAAVDRGIAATFSRLGCRYSVNRTQHDIKVVVLQGEIAPESGTPAFRVPITHFSQYYNGEWDMMKGSREKVHYLLAAGQMIGAGVPYGDVMIIPTSQDEVFIQTITDHEFEHIGLAWYDGIEFERTKYHGEGTNHPIIPPCPGLSEAVAPFQTNAVSEVEPQPRGLVGAPRSSCVMLTK